MALFGRKPRDEQTIDLREPQPVRQEFGYPTPCPACGANGYLDSIDVTDRVMYQHCPTCWAKWRTTERELTSSA